MPLFSTPDEIALAEQERQQREAAQLAALGTSGGAYLGMRAGQQLGGLLSGASPSMQRAQAAQDALNEASHSGFDVGTTDFFHSFTKALAKRNLGSEALSVADAATKWGLTTAQTGEAAAKAAEAEQKTKQQEMFSRLLQGYGQQDQTAIPAEQGGGPPAPAPAAPRSPNQGPAPGQPGYEPMRDPQLLRYAAFA